MPSTARPRLPERRGDGPERESRRLLLELGPIASPELEGFARARELQRCSVGSWSEALAHVVEAPPNSTIFLAAGSCEVVPRLVELAAAAAEADCSLGVLLGASRHDVAEAALRLGPRPEPLAAQSQPLLAAHAPMRGARNTRADGPDDVRRLLTSEHDVVIIEGHGGPHVSAGFGQFVCARADLAEPAAADGGLPCFYGEACRIANHGLAPLGLSAVRARVLGLLVCSGVSGAADSFAYSVGLGLMQNRHLRGLLTSVRTTTALALDVAPLYYALNEGRTLGAVANQLNRLRLQRGFEADIVCFGDAELHVAASSRTIAAPAGGDSVELDLDELASDGPLDVRVELATTPARPVAVVDSEPSVLGGVLDVSRRLHLTFAAGTPDASVRLVDASELERTADVERILADSETLLDAAELWNAGAECAAELSGAVLALRGMLVAQLRRRIPWGYVLAGADLARERRQLEAAVGRVGELVLASTFTKPRPGRQSAGEGRPMSFLHMTTAIREAAGTRVLDEACPYCGAPVDEAVHFMGARRRERRLGCCRNCGPVYDAAPGGPRWIDGPGRCVAGETAQFHIAAMGCPGAVVLARLKLWGNQPAQSVESETLRLRATPACSPLAFRITPDRAFANGLTTLGAALAFDASVSFIQRPLHVAGPRLVRWPAR